MPYPPGCRKHIAIRIGYRQSRNFGSIKPTRKVGYLRPGKAVVYRFADDIRGELRRDINVVPAVTITLDSNLTTANAFRGGVTFGQGEG